MNVGKHCHFIGIGGIGMSGLARILMKHRVEISGSDLSANYVTEKLSKEGIKIHVGHSADHISKEMTVIYTTGVDDRNPEYAKALELGCPVLHRSDLLHELMKGHRALCVAGTHGKTTTSSLLATVLIHAEKDPTFAIGGVLREFQTNSLAGGGSYFVAEACESDGTFTKYDPYGAIVTNIDLDHLDFFRGEGALIASFEVFMNKVTHPEFLFWCGDDSRLRTLNLPGVSYGHGEKCALRVLNEKQNGWHLFFDVAFEGKIYSDVEVPLIGTHNALNAAAVFGLCLSLGVPENVIREGLKRFQGVNRRCEKKGECREVLVIDDYAHHPVEILTTLDGIRRAVGERRIIVVFQPHRYTRTQDCLGTFASAFDRVDEVIVTDIYAAQERPIPGIVAERVTEEIQEKREKSVRYVPKNQLAEVVAAMARPHDVIVTLGAGDITGLGAELLSIWEHTPPKKWKIGVVFGGKSMEHEISLLSADHVVQSLDKNLYDVELFGIQKNGTWMRCQKLPAQLPDTLDENSTLSPDVLGQLQTCEIFFPILHGPYGEDGTLQGFFDTLGKAYIGCDHRSAALCMDKALTKKVASLEQIPVVPALSFSQRQWLEEKDVLRTHIQRELRYPVFVKPLHLGSTVGVSKVESPDQLPKAIEKAFHLDTHLLVENGLKIREIEFAVLGNDHPKTFPPGEILVNGRVYDYQGKYGDEDPIQAIPRANLPEPLIELGMAWAKKAYQAAGCTGMARVDFFLDDENQLWLNEINPIPGFTKISLYPQICAANGLSGNKLIDELVILGFQRKRRLERSLENL